MERHHQQVTFIINPPLPTINTAIVFPPPTRLGAQPQFLDHITTHPGRYVVNHSLPIDSVDESTGPAVGIEHVGGVWVVKLEGDDADVEARAPRLDHAWWDFVNMFEPHQRARFVKGRVVMFRC